MAGELTSADSLELGKLAIHWELATLKAWPHARAGARLLPSHTKTARATLHRATTRTPDQQLRSNNTPVLMRAAKFWGFRRGQLRGQHRLTWPALYPRPFLVSLCLAPACGERLLSLNRSASAFTGTTAMRTARAAGARADRMVPLKKVVEEAA
jgi:hypothetical protein